MSKVLLSDFHDSFQSCKFPSIAIPFPKRHPHILQAGKTKTNQYSAMHDKGDKEIAKKQAKGPFRRTTKDKGKYPNNTISIPTTTNEKSNCYANNEKIPRTPQVEKEGNK